MTAARTPQPGDIGEVEVHFWDGPRLVPAIYVVQTIVQSYIQGDYWVDREIDTARRWDPIALGWTPVSVRLDDHRRGILAFADREDPAFRAGYIEWSPGQFEAEFARREALRGVEVTSARAPQNGDRSEVRVMFPDGPRMLPATCSYAPEDDDVFSEAEWEIDAVEGWVITRLHSGLTVAEIANERGGRSLSGNVEYLARSRESDDGEWNADVFLSVTIGLMTFTGYSEAFHEPYAEIAEQVASDNALEYIINSFAEHIDLSVDTIQWSDNAPWITEDIDAQLSPDS
ncbi:hypothetical protein IHQ68_04470 [Chelatococcus sambhunathii]|uniref:Uncharacterized protein n=1 Tax=Chelatococcus sambhunathii TaxID=363953 RepID=A0ABU1DCN6_9HYPH|nr:hypothetical protein [Chelatococcus sambhunathii]MDR4305880.1 hypothetical protein [Chelatococcus sambhunathii]